MNGGSCTDQTNGYVCACPGGFTGVNCQLSKGKASPFSIFVTCVGRFDWKGVVDYVCHARHWCSFEVLCGVCAHARA